MGRRCGKKPVIDFLSSGVVCAGRFDKVRVGNSGRGDDPRLFRFTLHTHSSYYERERETCRGCECAGVCSNYAGTEFANRDTKRPPVARDMYTRSALVFLSLHNIAIPNREKKAKSTRENRLLNSEDRVRYLTLKLPCSQFGRQGSGGSPY